MSRNANQPSSNGAIRVFEFTMDDPEDQDELNRRLRKPGEPDPAASPKSGQAVPGEPSAGKR